ncbi:MAG: hypothetical protein KatS3mg061_1867 [Dehalococcoidia bacterium]|nr:MAG: hypothetical protein KatS3mg061_1867 [Dehalococcoidia bacterium]
MVYTAITVEGGLFPSDLLDRVATGEGPGQAPKDFGFEGSRLSDEIQSAFSDVRAYWDAFQRRLAHSKESATTITRENWVAPLLDRLGFTLVYQRPGPTIGGEVFPISHRAGDDPSAPPVHIVAIGQPLDRKEGARRSPHALVQEYLNRSDALWGIVTNGERLRLLRDSARLSRPTYLEFDLRGLVESNLYSEFVLLYRLVHRTRFPRGAADAHACVLERLYQAGIDAGGRVREKLREGVEHALEILGQAFLSHPDSAELRDAIARGRLDAADYYRQLLRLVYRLLFLFVAEERRLIFPPEDVPSPLPGLDEGPGARAGVYYRYYSVSRLRERCERPFASDHFSDLWQGLLTTFRLFRDEQAASHLGLVPLDGELFGAAACRDLEGAGCENAALLRAIFHLSPFSTRARREQGAAVRGGRATRSAAASTTPRSTWRSSARSTRASSICSRLSSRPPPRHCAPPLPHRWGSGPSPSASSLAASARRPAPTTPRRAGHELMESALVPVIEERLRSGQDAGGAGAGAAQHQDLRSRLGLRPLPAGCRQAAGPGAGKSAQRRGRARTRDVPARRAGRHPPVYLRGGQESRSPSTCARLRSGSRGTSRAAAHFLDHHVKCGDSLVGVFDLTVLRLGIPDEAYKRR